jgi:hypothetical protein
MPPTKVQVSRIRAFSLLPKQSTIHRFNKVWSMSRLGGYRLLGRFFASTRAKLREIGERLGVRHLVNLTGCPLR